MDLTLKWTVRPAEFQPRCAELLARWAWYSVGSSSRSNTITSSRVAAAALRPSTALKAQGRQGLVREGNHASKRGW